MRVMVVAGLVQEETKLVTKESTYVFQTSFTSGSKIVGATLL